MNLPEVGARVRIPARSATGNHRAMPATVGTVTATWQDGKTWKVAVRCAASFAHVHPRDIEVLAA